MDLHMKPHTKIRSITLAGLITAVAMVVVGQSVPVRVARGSGLSLAPAAASDATTALHERNPRYKLQKGDSFDLELALSPELNQTLAVQPDGYVTLKSVGSVYVEGQTIPELTETIKAAYSKILHDPVISINLRDFEKPYFIATGQVGRPGKYELRSSLTITEAVAIAGGFTEKSKHSEVVLFRPTADGRFDSKVLNIKKLLADRNLSEDARLQPGDVVYVPQNKYSKVRPYIPSPSTGAGIYYSPVPF